MAVERFVRFVYRGQVLWGRLQDDGARVRPIRGDLFGNRAPWWAPAPMDQVRLLAPVVPRTIICVGRNYRAHAAELGNAVPTRPKLFLKPPSALNHPGGEIEIPPATTRVDHEGELAVVIGRRASRVPAERALEYALGYTCANDVTCRDFQRADTLFTRGKGFDGFCPLGPCVAVGLDPSDLRIQVRLNGAVRQDGRTSQMVFDLPTLIAEITHIMTLSPGDVILTGTPSGVGPMVAGDEVEVEIEGIGTLKNPVVDRADR